MPPTLAAIHFGTPYFSALVFLACGLLVWEWNRLCGCPAASLPAFAAQAGVLGAVLAVILGRLDIAFAVLVAGAVVAPVLGHLARRKGDESLQSTASDGARGRWIALGILYVGLPSMLLVWIRDDVGRETGYWMFVLVWATDTGAFLFGRLIGGPKLAPSISPKKTWAGLIGGILCSGAVGIGFATASGHEALWPLAVLSGGLAVVAQAGDFFESWVKRRFGVKDSGGIMPGHGGLLDRVDGLLAVAVTVALIAGFGRENGLVWL